ncbi:MAG TPA: hypothetical protein VKG26_11395 [Bacteroidia bacterium]|nr:hypothetical protein [Bacteroidia bacterium]
MKYLFFIILVICLITSCANSKTEKVESNIIYGFETEENILHDSLTVKNALQLINSVSDSLSFTDTAIYNKIFCCYLFVAVWRLNV